MILNIARSEREFDEVAAWRIIGQMLSKPDSVIGLSTGQTTGNMHAIVSEIYKLHPFETSNVTIYNVDELTNLPREYSGSCYTMIKTQLCDHINIPEQNFIMPPTLSDDFEAECVKFEDELVRRGGMDLQMLGIGWNGHIGINQPGTPFESRTWVSPMDPIFEERVRRETGVGPDHKLGGLTLGIKTIMQTRTIVLIAKGKNKAEIIKKAVCGPVTIDIPASVLQLHPNCEVLLDPEAASLL
jgi:glucosamine-6-phosphate deaminase